MNGPAPARAHPPVRGGGVLGDGTHGGGHSGLRSEPGILDAHSHAGEGVGLPLAGGPPPLARQLARWRDAGVRTALVFSGFHPDYAAANRAVAAIVRRHPGRLIGLACLHANTDRLRLEALVAEAVRVHGFVGLKVHRRDAPLTEPICRIARAHALPLVYDPMGEVDATVQFALAYPDVPFIVPHLGSFADDAAAQRRLVPWLARLPNLFADTSGVKLFDLLADAVRRAGPRKILFGSDAPWLHPGLEIAKVRALRLPPADAALVLGGNARRLFRLQLTLPRRSSGAVAEAAGPGR